MIINREWSFGVCEEGNDGQVIRVTISGCVWGCEDVQEEEGSGRGWGVYTEGSDGKEVIRVTISGRAGV